MDEIEDIRYARGGCKPFDNTDFAAFQNLCGRFDERCSVEQHI